VCQGMWRQSRARQKSARSAKKAASIHQPVLSRTKLARLAGHFKAQMITKSRKATALYRLVHSSRYRAVRTAQSVRQNRALQTTREKNLFLRPAAAVDSASCSRHPCRRPRANLQDPVQVARRREAIARS